jgi:cell shape-determining protein MreC
VGTQQILLIVLAVIIVGVAISVGISMFSRQAYNSNRQAVASELNGFATQIIEFWKTPASLGGAGKVISNVTVTRTATYIGFTATSPYNFISDNGEYRITGISGNIVTLKGLGTETKGNNKPLLTTAVNVTIDSLGTTVGTGTGF